MLWKQACFIQDQCPARAIAFYITDVPAVLYGLITGGATVAVKLEGVAHVILFDTFNLKTYKKCLR
jgi:hypothetical protein